MHRQPIPLVSEVVWNKQAKEIGFTSSNKVIQDITRKQQQQLISNTMNLALPVRIERSILYVTFFNTKGQVVVIYLSKSKWTKDEYWKGHLKAISLEWMFNTYYSSKSKNEKLNNFKLWNLHLKNFFYPHRIPL